MYVRWKKRMKMYRKRPTGEYALTAVLVESERTNGQPRQRIVSYLGTIGSNRTAFYYHLLDFWTSASQHLDALELSAGERERIEAVLVAVVPKPTQAGRSGAETEAARLLAGLTGKL